MNERKGDVEDLLRAIEAEHAESARTADFQRNFDNAKEECLFAIEKIVAGVNDMTAEDHEAEIRKVITHYFEALMTPQQIELKKAIFKTSKSRDEATSHILSLLLENYG